MVERENRRGERILLKEKRPVVIAPIGSDIRYRLETRNVSDKGLFLEHENPERFPFTNSSLMEIWFDAGGEALICFIAKMMRQVGKSDEKASLWGTGIAIKIIQIAKEDEERLGAFLDKEVANKNNSVKKEGFSEVS